MTKKTKTAVAGVAAAGMFAGGAATAYAAVHDRFGYTAVRSGGTPRASPSAPPT